ncbi:hypothetical protein L1049_004960 [Liquidambar formosana]|uniref:Large ribosomal subunit protein eL19 domain-containing protein n=1 Tax=Liquidambar formosana TaxID=63359 RepID=A0AAP0RPU6_LIQFO
MCFPALSRKDKDVRWQNIRKLVKDGFIIRKPTKIHSRSRARRMKEAKRKGRHFGYGSKEVERSGVTVRIGLN